MPASTDDVVDSPGSAFRGARANRPDRTGPVAFAAALAGIATLLSVVTLNRGLSAGVVTGGLLAMYLLDAISRIEAGLDWIGTFSAFRYLRSTAAIGDGRLPTAEIALFGIIAICAWGVAVWAFRGRDLVA
jgi:hypothetical protein